MESLWLFHFYDLYVKFLANLLVRCSPPLGPQSQSSRAVSFPDALPTKITASINNTRRHEFF